MSDSRVGVIIPCFRVGKRILNLLEKLDDSIYNIYLIDDQCPENTSEFVLNSRFSARINVFKNEKNLGVGGAVKKGFQLALNDGCDVFVKLDGDGQMNPDLIPFLIKPLLLNEADYAKGNRFHNLNALKRMPFVRLFGNSCLSFINKVVSGYWGIMDPTNGFIAINREALSLLPLEKIENRFFFESDMLFRLSTIQAVVTDFPMDAIYEDEESNLSVGRVLIDFPLKYCSRFFKRLFYNYFLRDFNLGSIHLIFGFLLTLFGVVFGGIQWYSHGIRNISTPTGTIMIAVLTIILGFQLLLSFLNYDVSSAPRNPLSKS
jgi:dolichol-phosphate mannosyltransferase